MATRTAYNDPASAENPSPRIMKPPIIAPAMPVSVSLAEPKAFPFISFPVSNPARKPPMIHHTMNMLSPDLKCFATTDAAFLCSCFYLVFMLVGAAAGLYPALLPSSSDSARDITIAKALSGPYTLRVGLVWWTLGMLLAAGYFSMTYPGCFAASFPVTKKATDTERRHRLRRLESAE